MNINSRDNIKLIYNILQKYSKITDKRKILQIIKNKCVEYNNYYNITNLDDLTNLNELIIQYIIDTYLSKKDNIKEEIKEDIKEDIKEEIVDNNLLDYNNLIKSVNEEEDAITNYLYTPENINISYKISSSLDNEFFNKFIFKEDNIEIEYILIPKNLVYLPYIKINENIFINDKEINNNIMFKPINNPLKWNNIDILEINNIKLINNKIHINEIQKKQLCIDLICNDQNDLEIGNIIELKTDLDIDDELNKINNMYKINNINKNLITISLLNDEVNKKEIDTNKIFKNINVDSSNYFIINHTNQIHIIYKII